MSIKLKYASWYVIAREPGSLISLETIMTCIYHGTTGYEMHRLEIQY